MKYNYLRKILLIVLVLVSASSFAQGPPPPPPPVAPIDGGILGLFLAAVSYAVYKIRRSSKK
jgi:hypothetical protein